MILIRLIEAIACYDLAKTSSNIASIFHSHILSQSAKKHLGDSLLSKMAVDAVTRFDNWSQLSDRANTKTPKSLTEAITHGTLALQQANPYIERLLEKKN